jgi:hypothetical protein
MREVPLSLEAARLELERARGDVDCADFGERTGTGALLVRLDLRVGLVPLERRAGRLAEVEVVELPEPERLGRDRDAAGGVVPRLATPRTSFSLPENRLRLRSGVAVTAMLVVLSGSGG